MVIDVTGIVLTPGNQGKDCLGNGEHITEKGYHIEWCCDECDYYLCCFPDTKISKPNPMPHTTDIENKII